MFNKNVRVKLMIDGNENQFNAERIIHKYIEGVLHIYLRGNEQHRVELTFDIKKRLYKKLIMDLVESGVVFIKMQED